MERVNFPYQSAYDEGYRHAIMDAVNWLEGHSESAHYYRMSYDHVIKILKLMRENYEGMFNGDFDILVVIDKDKPKKVKELRIKKNRS